MVVSAQKIALADIMSLLVQVAKKPLVGYVEGVEVMKRHGWVTLEVIGLDCAVRVSVPEHLVSCIPEGRYDPVPTARRLREGLPVSAEETCTAWLDLDIGEDIVGVNGAYSVGVRTMMNKTYPHELVRALNDCISGHLHGATLTQGGAQ